MCFKSDLVCTHIYKCASFKINGNDTEVGIIYVKPNDEEKKITNLNFINSNLSKNHM